MGWLHFLLGAAGLGVAWASFGAPLLWLGIRQGRKVPERVKVRAIPWAIAVGGWTGLVLGLAGFGWGASVGDESAGAIASMLFSIGCSSGTPLGSIAAWFFIKRRVLNPKGVPTH
jgi:hypothetical protein